ncbi:MAG: hypothetical protein K1000chlam4_00043, partial [Chlamydiae bacterium]|nr:hypothetical protein [Chlamydiota bacterium]
LPDTCFSFCCNWDYTQKYCGMITQIVKYKLSTEVPAPELSLEQALEKAREGGPAKEVFTAVRENSVQTKELAQSRYKTLKQQVELRQDHSGIDKLGDKLDLQKNAPFGQKVKQAAEQIAKKKEAAVAKRDGFWSQQKLLKSKLDSLPTDLETSLKMSEELTTSNTEFTEKTNSLLDELGKLTDKLDKTENDRVVLNRETKVAQLKKDIQAKTNELDGVRVKIGANEQTIQAAHEKRLEMRKRLSELPGELETSYAESTKLSSEIDGLDQSMGELNAIKLKAGEKSEALLEQLLNSFVLQRAVDAYAENPQQQAPENFLHTYKLYNRDKLKSDFIKELDAIGISSPDIVWVQLNP